MKNFLRISLPLVVASLLNASAQIDAPEGFKVEKIYDVPREQGSWVSLAFDPLGRLICSHERGGLYRVERPPIDEKVRAEAIEKLPVQIPGAHGLLHAFDALYAVAGGVWRIEGSSRAEKLFSLEGRGEHGPHAIVLGPEKKWIYLIAGNATKLPDGLTRTRVCWEASGQPNPQGWVMRFNRDGTERELYAVGLRNAYGLALSPDGDLFTCDSDNEGYMNLPWYRPTQIFHITSGADFGWRQGPETRQPYQHDNVPPVLSVGPGSPAGMTFGTGANFPIEYQRALFVSDWSYGRIYAIHLQPHGATYRATKEFFLSGRPLAVADLRVGPDGALYFVTGGRQTRSALYRVTAPGHIGSFQLARPNPPREERRKLEEYHGRHDLRAVVAAWNYLSIKDRSIRHAARVALEHQPVDNWIEYVWRDKHPRSSLEALLALARQGDAQHRDRILEALNAKPWSGLTKEQQLALLRIYEITFRRLGIPEDKAELRARFQPLYPDEAGDINRELIKLAVDLRLDDLIDNTIQVLAKTPTAMRQIHYLNELGRYQGKLSEEQRRRLVATLDLPVIRETGTRGYKEVTALIASLLQDIGTEIESPSAVPELKLVKEWTLNELLPSIEDHALKSRDPENGRAVYRRVQCHRCHRIGNSGGVLGPNLTGLSGRFSARDVLEAIVEPNKVVADPYRATIFTKADGTEFTGQIVNLNRDHIQIRLDPAKPFPRVSFRAADIKSIRPSSVSLMPAGLLNTLTREEIQDLLAYLLRRP